MAAYTREIVVDWGTTGAAASLYYTVKSGATVRTARTNTGVTEDGTSGVYYVAAAAFDTDWLSGRILWDDGTDYAAEAFDARVDVRYVNGDLATPDPDDPATTTDMGKVLRILQSRAR